jgi:hypothetical protein
MERKGREGCLEGEALRRSEKPLHASKNVLGTGRTTDVRKGRMTELVLGLVKGRGVVSGGLALEGGPESVVH